MSRTRRNNKPARRSRWRLAIESLESKRLLHAEGALSGFVYVDADANGARDVGEFGIPGVVVALSGTDVSGASIDRSIITDDQGEYSFDELEAGTYRLSQRQSDALVDGSDSSPMAGVVENDDELVNVVLEDDGSGAENNFGEVAVQAEFVNIRWFLASTPPPEVMLRATLALSEELAGNSDLANSIRAGGNDVPDRNAPPIANNDSFTVDDNVELVVDAQTGVLANDADSDGDTLTAVRVTEPQNGSLTLNEDGSFTYTPNEGFAGSDSFSYRANDGSDTSNLSTVTINVTTNRPTANDDSFTVEENGTLTINAPGVLSNDVDANDDTLSAILAADTRNGSLTLERDGSFTYAPNAGFSGTDSFTYRANDGTDDSSVATVTIRVAANSSPVANDDMFTVSANNTLTINTSGVLTNDVDANNDTLTATRVADPTNGSLTFNNDGSFEYTPDPEFTGTDSFTYRVSDGTNNSNDAIATITVLPAFAPFGPVTAGSFDDSAVLGVRTDLLPGAPPITREHVNGDVDYSRHSNPPTYGDHHPFDPVDGDVNPGPTPRETGVYATEQPEEDLIHNLEHGHVWISYNPSLISENDLILLDQMIRAGSDEEDGGGVGVIMTARSANDDAIALVSWGRLQTLDRFDEATIRNFVETNRGKAPEGFLTP